MHADPGNKSSLEAGPPQTLTGLKRRATRIKKARGIRHAEALEIVAQSMGHTSYRSALTDLESVQHAPIE